jgi:hypothetical protein
MVSIVVSLVKVLLVLFFHNIPLLCETLDYLCHFLRTFSCMDTFQLTERGQGRRYYLLNPGKKVGKDNNEQAFAVL